MYKYKHVDTILRQEIYKQLFSSLLIFFLVLEQNPIFFSFPAPHVDQSTVIVRRPSTIFVRGIRPPTKPTQVQVTSIQAVARLRLLIWTCQGSIRTRQASIGLTWPLIRTYQGSIWLRQASPSLARPPTSFSVTCLTSDRNSRYSPDLWQAVLSLAEPPTSFPDVRWTSDKLPRHLSDLRRTPVPLVCLWVWFVAEVLGSDSASLCL